MRGLRMSIPRLRPSTASLLLFGVACIAWPGAASAQVSFNNNARDRCPPGVTMYMTGDGISQGLHFVPCPNQPAPAPVAAAPAPADAPAATPAPVDTPAAAQDDTPSPVAADTSSPAPAPVVVVPPPHVRIPVAVPTYAPSSATNGPGANAVGGGKATDSYYNPSNAVAPTSRAVVNGADWCRRSDRSKAAMDACLKSVAGR